jgi:uncharacterized membrane protein YdjX (TVP38/TMEM64 family)
MILMAGAIIGSAAIIFYHGKQVGRDQAKNKQKDIDDAARKRMEAVKPADSGSVIDSLRDGRF